MAGDMPKKEPRILRPVKTRVRGVRMAQVAFRIPADMKDELDERAQAGFSKTDVVLAMLQMGLDVTRGLGVDFYEVERRAKVAGVPTGEVLAGLVQAALGTEAKKPKK